MELVILKVFNTEVEAEMIKVFLEVNHVESFIFGNILANIYNVFNTTSGGVQLKVSVVDFDKASELLHQYYDDKKE